MSYDVLNPPTTGFRVQTRLLRTVASIIELSIQSSLQLSITELACYGFHSSI